MRKKIMAGNWKMNMSSSEALDFVDSLSAAIIDEKRVEMIICPTYLCLESLAKRLKGTNIKLGAQNMYWEASGAFTGEISGEMLAQIGCEYVIIGHSERRQYFGDNDISVNIKVKKALEIGLKPIMCVGETLEEREAGKTDDVVTRQLELGLKDIKLNPGSAENLIIAYEPVWAIGTGKTCETDEANRVIALLRKSLANQTSQDIANQVRILYGGSVKPGNVRELLSTSDIDGGLVGGASLKPDSFSQLVTNSL